jgi:hypothetical protein
MPSERTRVSAANTLRGGDTVTDPAGVMTYTWAGNAASGNAYRLRPIGALGGTAVFDAANPRPDAPPATGTGPIKVASANLLNFFNTFTGCRLGTQGAVTDCRGASDSTEYGRQLAKEVASLRFTGADVVGYMEMENDGYGPDSAVQALVNALNAADGPGTWAFVNPDAATAAVSVARMSAVGCRRRPPAETTTWPKRPSWKCSVTYTVWWRRTSIPSYGSRSPGAVRGRVTSIGSTLPCRPHDWTPAAFAVSCV